MSNEPKKGLLAGPESRHGHILKRADGTFAPCGGVRMCRRCRIEFTADAIHDLLCVDRAGTVDDVAFLVAQRVELEAGEKYASATSITDALSVLLRQIPMLDQRRLGGLAVAFDGMSRIARNAIKLKGRPEIAELDAAIAKAGIMLEAMRIEQDPTVPNVTDTKKAN